MRGEIVLDVLERGQYGLPVGRDVPVIGRARCFGLRAARSPPSKRVAASVGPERPELRRRAQQLREHRAFESRRWRTT